VDRRAVCGIILTLLLTGVLTLAFNIQPAKAWTGTVYIRADGSIDPPDAPIMTYDNITYTLTDDIKSVDYGIVVERNGIVLDGNDYTVQGEGTLDSKGIYLAERSNITVRNINIKGFHYNFYLSYSSNNNIFGNEIGPKDGVWLDNSSNNTISQNNMVNVTVGIGLIQSFNNAIIKNNIINGTGIGIEVSGSSDNIISENIMTNCPRGIWVKAGDFNYIAKNNIKVATKQGLTLSQSSNNTVIQNNLVYNYRGMYLYDSLNNKIHHNNFVNNSIQVDSVNSLNTWDDGYPSGGNYWSDYSGTDFYNGEYQNETGSDGIGDAPYIIDINNTDRYPLMGLFGGLTSEGQNVTVYPSSNVCLIFEIVNVGGFTTVDVRATGPDAPSGFKLAGNYYDIKTTANISGKIKIRIVYDDTNMTSDEENSLCLMQWNETSQQWMDITIYLDTENNAIYGETTHLSLFVIIAPRRARVIPIPCASGSFFFKNLVIAPAEAFIGEKQNFTIWVRHSLGISKVIATISWGMETLTEETVELKLIKGTCEEGCWQGSWIVQCNRSCYINFHFRAWNNENVESLPLLFEFEPYREFNPDKVPSDRASEWIISSHETPTPRWAILDPGDPRKDEIQIYAVRYVDSKGVQTATATYLPDSGQQGVLVIVDLKLVKGTHEDGWWMGAWKVRHYPPAEDFQVRFEAWNTQGERSEVTLTVIPLPPATVYIHADGTVDPPDAPIVTFDNITYTLTDNIMCNEYPRGIVVKRDNIIIDGAGYVVRGSGSYKGIELGGRSNVTVRNLTIKNFDCGIWLWSSSRNNISRNNIINNKEGIQLVKASNDVLSRNNITNNSIGIRFGWPYGDSYYKSSYIRVSGNKLTNNNIGIYLGDSSYNNICRNTIANNGYGIWVQYSSHNKIFYNNFINNNQQVYIYPTGYANVWDNAYPSGGNFWSDYTGVDLFSGPYQNETGSDGIGDTPYVIDANNTDHYPLMNPYGAPPQTYNLTITTTVGGTTDPVPGTYTYEEPTHVTVTAIPYANYRFDHWVYDDEDIGSENPVTVYVGSNHTLHAVFTLVTYTLKIETTTGGTTSPAPGTYTYTAGSTVEVTAIPDSGYVFDHWELNGSNVGSGNPYTVNMDNNYFLKAFFASAPTPPSASISPMSASILVGEHVTFTSTVSGGTPPYAYQWYLNGNPVSGATSDTWTFTPTESGIFYVYLKVTDDKGNTAQSETARITVSAVPVGGYSYPINKYILLRPIATHIALIAILTTILITVKRKAKRKH